MGWLGSLRTPSEQIWPLFRAQRLFSLKGGVEARYVWKTIAATPHCDTTLWHHVTYPLMMPSNGLSWQSTSIFPSPLSWLGPTWERQEGQRRSMKMAGWRMVAPVSSMIDRTRSTISAPRRQTAGDQGEPNVGEEGKSGTMDLITHSLKIADHLSVSIDF